MQKDSLEDFIKSIHLTTDPLNSHGFHESDFLFSKYPTIIKDFLSFIEAYNAKQGTANSQHVWYYCQFHIWHQTLQSIPYKVNGVTFARGNNELHFLFSAGKEVGEGRDFKTKNITDSPLKIGYWTLCHALIELNKSIKEQITQLLHSKCNLQIGETNLQAMVEALFLQEERC